MKPSWVIASWLPPRVLKIAALSLSLILSVAVSAYAQVQQPQRPASRDAARSGPTQNFLGWLRQFGPIPSRQSRAVSLPPLPPSSTNGTYVSTNATNFGRACARLGSIRPNAVAH